VDEEETKRVSPFLDSAHLSLSFFENESLFLSQLFFVKISESAKMFHLFWVEENGSGGFSIVA
jgi:hypothetical protein